MADVRRINGWHSADIRLIYGYRLTYGHSPADIRLMYGRHAADIRPIYGWHTPDIRLRPKANFKLFVMSWPIRNQKPLNRRVFDVVQLQQERTVLQLLLRKRLWASRQFSLETIVSYICSTHRFNQLRLVEARTTQSTRKILFRESTRPTWPYLIVAIPMRHIPQRMKRRLQMVVVKS